jgi:hypothetical protein
MVLRKKKKPAELFASAGLIPDKCWAMNSAISGGLPPTRQWRDGDDGGGDGEIAWHSGYGWGPEPSTTFSVTVQSFFGYFRSQM